MACGGRPFCVVDGAPGLERAIAAVWDGVPVQRCTRKGELWQTFKRHFGAEGDTPSLLPKGTSRDLNPSLPQSFIDTLERDRAHATAEYLAEFRTDIKSFVPMEVVEACVEGYREQLPGAPRLVPRLHRSVGRLLQLVHARDRPQER